MRGWKKFLAKPSSDSPHSKWIVVETGGFLGMNLIVAVIDNASFTEEVTAMFAKRIAAGLNADYFASLSDDDLVEVEKRANEIQDTSRYGGGIILALINEVKNFKEGLK